MASAKKIYLYAVSLISLVIIMYAGITLLNMGLTAAVFKEANVQPQFSQCPSAPISKPGQQAPEQVSGQAPAQISTCDPALQAAQQKYAQETAAASRERDASRSLAMLIIAAPVFWYHWRLARREA